MSCLNHLVISGLFWAAFIIICHLKRNEVKRNESEKLSLSYISLTVGHCSLRAIKRPQGVKHLHKLPCVAGKRFALFILRERYLYYLILSVVTPILNVTIFILNYYLFSSFYFLKYYKLFIYLIADSRKVLIFASAIVPYN